MNYKDYKFKKGDKVSFTFTFGPTNIKKSKASYMMADVVYVNEYNVKILFPLQGQDLLSLDLISQAH